MSEKRKGIPAPPTPSANPGYTAYGAEDDIAGCVLTLAVSVGLFVGFCVAAAFFYHPQPDVWAQMDRDFSACIERGIDEVSCQRIVLEMAGIDLADIGMEVDVAE